MGKQGSQDTYQELPDIGKFKHPSNEELMANVHRVRPLLGRRAPSLPKDLDPEAVAPASAQQGPLRRRHSFTHGDFAPGGWGQRFWEERTARGQEDWDTALDIFNSKANAQLAQGRWAAAPCTPTRDQAKR